MMSMPPETDQAIRDSGLRCTVPRAVVARALQANPGHHSVGEIQDCIDRDFHEAASIARSSVYRALDALEGVGLVAAIRRGQEETAFEWVKDRPHHHIVCEDCEEELELSGPAFERLVNEIQQQTGWHARVAHLTVRGRCPRCERQSHRERQTNP